MRQDAHTVYVFLSVLNKSAAMATEHGDLRVELDGETGLWIPSPKSSPVISSELKQYKETDISYLGFFGSCQEKTDRKKIMIVKSVCGRIFKPLLNLLESLFMKGFPLCHVSHEFSDTALPVTRLRWGGVCPGSAYRSNWYFSAQYCYCFYLNRSTRVPYHTCD